MLSSIHTVSDLKHYNRQFDAVIERFNIHQNHLEVTTYCKENEVNQDFLEELLMMFDDSTYLPVQKLMGFNITVVLDYLQKTHNYYLNKKIPEIEQSIFSLAKINQLPTGLLHIIKQCFYQFKIELKAHINLEEAFLIPYAHELALIGKGGNAKTSTLSYSTKEFVLSHNQLAETKLDEFSQLLRKNYNYLRVGVLCNQLDALSLDLKIHHVLEEEVLVPNLQKIEKGIK